MSYANRSLALAAILTAALLAALGPAQASTPDRAGVGAVRGPAAPEQVTSRYLAGYAGAGGDEGLQVKFRVPSFDCGPTETSSLMTGVVANLTTDEATFVNGGGGVFLSCQDGVPATRAALFDPTGEAADAGQVSVGDKIRVTYESSATGGFASSTLENLSARYVTVTGPFEYIRTTDFEVGDLALTFEGAAEGPVPDARRTTMKPVKVDGRKLKKALGIARYVLVDAEGETIRTPSRLQKGGFSVTPASPNPR